MRNRNLGAKVTLFYPGNVKTKDSTSDAESENSEWWRRGRVELPVQKKLSRTCYKLSQLFLSYPVYLN